MQEHSDGKRCPGCGEWKPFDDFYRNRSTRTGYQLYCKPCWRVRSETSRQKHLEARRAAARNTAARFRAEHPDTYKERQANWYAANGLTYHRQWQEEHREDVRAAVRKYRAAHRDEQQVKTNNRRAKRDGVAGEITLQDWLALRARHHDTCASCHQAVKLEIDHVVPMKLGGLNIISNIQPLCHGCNTRKKQQTTDYRLHN